MMERFLTDWMNRREDKKQHRDSMAIQEEAQKRARVLLKMEDFQKNEYQPYVENGQVEEAERRRLQFIQNNPDVREYVGVRTGRTALPTDKLNAARASANLDAIQSPYVTTPPVGADGNVSYDAMHTRMGAGMSPEPINSIETFRRLNTAYNLQTGDNPNEATTKAFGTFALQGEPGWRETNAIAGGQRPDANQLTRTGEDRRQFDTRFPFERRKTESEIEENNASAFAARERGTNRSSERVTAPVGDGQFNFLRERFNALLDGRDKLIAAGKPTEGVDRQIAVVRRDLVQRGTSIGVDMYGQSLSAGRSQAMPSDRPATSVNPPARTDGAATPTDQTFGGNAEFVIESVMKKFGYTRDEAIANLKARGYL